MTKEIRGVAEKCEACQLQKPWNKKETLEEEGETAWARLVSICLRSRAEVT